MEEMRGNSSEGRERGPEAIERERETMLTLLHNASKI